MTDASDVSLTAEVGKGTLVKSTIAILGFASTIVFTHFVTPRTLGGYFLILTLVAVAGRPLVGFGVACKKRYSEIGAHRDELVTLLMAGTVLWTIFTAGGAALAAGWIQRYTGVASAPVLFVLLFASVETFKVVKQLVDGLGQLGVSTSLNLFRSTVALTVQVGLLVLGYDVAALAAGAAVAALVSVAVTLYTLDARLVWPTRATIRDVTGFARWTVPTETIGQVYSQLDILLLGLLVTPAAAGYYEVAFKLTAPAAFVSSLFGVGLMSVSSNLKSRGEAVREELENSLAYSSILAVPLFFGVLAIGDPLVKTVYGRGYEGVTLYLAGLALYRVVRTQAAPLGGLVTGIDRPDANLKAVATTTLFNIVVGVWLISVIGPVGVVVGTVLAGALHYLILRYYVTTEIAGVTFVQRQLLQQVLAGLVMYGVVRGVWAVIGATAWLPVLAAVGIGGVTYATVLAAVSDEFREPAAATCREIIGRPRGNA